MALVISLYGGPGAGKSTLAYKLAGLLKQHNYNAELVVEYVKHSAYTEARYELHDQIYLTAQHNHRLRILQDQVDIIVTDASLLNCLVYTNETDKLEHNLGLELYKRYDNIGFILPRKEKYMTVGRSQTHKEALELDKKINEAIQFLPEAERIDLRHIPVNDQGVLLLNTVFDCIVEQSFKRDIQAK